MMSPEEVEARFQRIEAIQANNAEQIAMLGEHIAMLLEDSKTRNADIESLIEETRLLNEQSRAAQAERDKDAEHIRALARIAESRQRRLDEIQGEQ